jgi:hypothetical protein
MTNLELDSLQPGDVIVYDSRRVGVTLGVYLHSKKKYQEHSGGEHWFLWNDGSNGSVAWMSDLDLLEDDVRLL